MRKADGPQKFRHVVTGTPDVDDCPICRAHGVPQGRPGDGEFIFIQELSASEILRCPCPMCADARKKEEIP